MASSSASGVVRIFSGVQPSGTLHLGNYLGAIKQWVQLQDTCRSVLYSVVDLHSLTVHQAPLLLQRNIRSVAVSLLACGVDPQRSILFQQSQVSQHAELAWLLGCLTPTGWLNRMTQWKSKGATDKRDLVALGLFAYPVLMSADILLYGASHVPVGHDQVQHLELARDIARTFNSTYGHTFQPPEVLLGEVHRVMSLRNPLQKMSKSDNQEMSCVNLCDTPDVIVKKIQKAVTDCTGEVSYDPDERPGVSNLVAIYAAMSGLTHQEVCGQFEGKQTVDFKRELAELLVERLAPIGKKVEELEADSGYVDSVLKEGAERAGLIACENLTRVKKKMGVI